MPQPSNHHITAALMVSPEKTQYGNRMPSFKQSVMADTHDDIPCMRKHRILALNN